MEKVDEETVDSLILAIGDQQNPTRAKQALVTVNKWLEENALGLLQISKEARERLEQAVAPYRFRDIWHTYLFSVLI